MLRAELLGYFSPFKCQSPQFFKHKMLREGKDSSFVVDASCNDDEEAPASNMMCGLYSSK